MNHEYQNGLVSVAIPAYKKEFLHHAIESVLAQSYSNFELIIINDNSPEDIDSIVETFCDKRIKYYKNDINLGKKSIVLNWNKCLTYASGEFFTLLCDDDIMDPLFLSSMISLSKKFLTCNVFRCRTKYYNSETKRYFGETKMWPLYENHEDFLKNKLLYNRKHNISEFLYRTKFINDIGGYIVFPIGYYSDDASILFFSQFGGIVSSPDTLITFRKSLVNITSCTKYNLKKVKAALAYYNWLERFIFKKQIQYDINNKLDFDLYEYFITCRSLYDAMKILFIIPHNVWNYKKKTIFLLNWFREHYLS